MREPLLTSLDGERVDGMLHLPGPGRWPCVITAHGLFSAKASDKFLLLAARLTAAGFACLRFDFRGCGESGGELKDTTVSGRIRDLKAVLTSLEDHQALDGRLFLMGSSLGGYVSLFVSAEQPDVQATAVWATPAQLRDLEGRKDTLQSFGLGESFFRELAQGSFVEAPGGVPRCLIIHGEEDELVPCSHAQALYERAKEPKALEILPGADHRLTDAQDRERAVRLTADWFKRHL
ncbi:MAG: alpha/beta hydrolase family protein [Candidatus Methylomirabilales bacterium]